MTISVSANSRSVEHINPTAMLQNLWRNRQLIRQMVVREVVVRYQGSFLGLTWSFFNPLVLLIVYTFVFSVVFKSHWSTGKEESTSEFAVMLFVGMIVIGLVTEVLNRAPRLILSNVNYVKKVLFPLEILPVVAMGAALFHCCVSLIVLLITNWALNGFIQWTAVFIPVVLCPLIILCLGVAWILASLGVYLRDVGQIVGVATTILMFVSPVFYPISALPEKYRSWLEANPLTFVIEQARAVLILGHVPDWRGIALSALIFLPVTWLGFAWFQKSRRGFADVL